MPPESSPAAAGHSVSDGLPAAIYQNIARQIREGACVLFLGPSAMTAKQPDGSWKPIVNLCANQLAQKTDVKGPDADSLALAASAMRLQKTLSDTMLIAAVQDFYDKMDKSAEAHPLLEQLSNLPFKIIINTTPDDFFARRYYAQAVRDHIFDFYNFRKPNPDPLYKFDENSAPLIYNLFGYYKKPESLVLTYSDQLAYVNKIMGAQHERLPDSLLAAFNMPRFYLFLGFDFEDWTLRILLDALFRNARSSIQPFSYPLKGMPGPDAQSRVFFQGEFKMEFPGIDFETFASQLLQHYSALEGGTEASDQAAKMQILVLHDEKNDGDASKKALSHLRSLKARIVTLADATGEGDMQAWIKKQLDQSQIVLPLVSADFFDDQQPYASLLSEIAQRNNPRANFLVMPIVLKSFSLEGTPLGALKTTRPLNKLAVFGEGKEDGRLTEITDALKKYIESQS